MADFTQPEVDSVLLADSVEPSSVTLSDALTIVVGKALADSITLSSAHVAGFSLTQALADTFTLAEAAVDTTMRETDSWGWGNTFWDDDL